MKTAMAAKKCDIPVSIGRQIVSEAATLKGTPYSLIGPSSSKGKGGDCSGTTHKIYAAANCPCQYQTAHAFADYAIKSGLFRRLSTGELKQDGDILNWDNHIAIYSSFFNDPDNAKTERPLRNGKGTWTQINDMWTAHNAGKDAPPYGAAALQWFRPDAPKIFRYQKCYDDVGDSLPAYSSCF